MRKSESSRYCHPNYHAVSSDLWAQAILFCLRWVYPVLDHSGKISNLIMCKLRITVLQTEVSLQVTKMAQWLQGFVTPDHPRVQSLGSTEEKHRTDFDFCKSSSDLNTYVVVSVLIHTHKHTHLYTHTQHTHIHSHAKCNWKCHLLIDF